MRSERFDIHQHITDQIVAMIEKGSGEFTLPWRAPSSTMRPINVASARTYRGVNILASWAAAEAAGYGCGIWGTYRQWTDAGAQVRRGEKASYVVFYKEAGGSGDADNEEDAAGNKGRRQSTKWIARASAVFAAEQVDGFTPPERPPLDPVVTIDKAETFVAGTGANIIRAGLANSDSSLSGFPA